MQGYARGTKCMTTNIRVQLYNGITGWVLSKRLLRIFEAKQIYTHLFFLLWDLSELLKCIPKYRETKPETQLVNEKG